MKTLFSFLTMSAILFGLSSITSAESDLGDVKFGDHLSGPKIKKKDLAGSVVAIEVWGTR